MLFITLSKKDAAGETDYVWNQEKRLIGATVKDAQGQVQQQLQYRYNNAGIRAASIVNGQETRYLLDEVQPYTEVLEEYVMSGTQGVSQVSYVSGTDWFHRLRAVRRRIISSMNWAVRLS